MKSLFRKIKIWISVFFNNEKGRVIEFSKDKNRLQKTIIYSSLTLIIMSLSCYTSILSVSVLKTNKSQTVAEQIINNNINKDSLGLIYGYETSPNTYELCSVQPELSKELRSINGNWEIYDVYPSDFNGSTPAIVNYLDNPSVEISFLLLPKENYTNSFFDSLYSFDLLCGKMNKDSNIEDIYINQKYADYLLNIKGLPENDYIALLDDPVIKLPYKNKYVSLPGKSITYNIKGVIKEDSDNYQKYKKYFGDFFLANQYLSLPLSSATSFVLGSNINDVREQLDLIYRVYDYKVSGRYFDALSFTYKYDYRTVSISALNSLNPITKLFAKDNAYFSQLNSIYDFYFNKQYIIPFVVLLVLNLMNVLLVVWSFFKVVKYSPLSLSSLVLLTSCILSIFVGLILNFIPLLNGLLEVPLSTKSWQAFVAMAIQLILIVIISTIIRVVKKHHNLRIK